MSSCYTFDIIPLFYNTGLLPSRDDALRRSRLPRRSASKWTQSVLCGVPTQSVGTSKKPARFYALLSIFLCLLTPVTSNAATLSMESFLGFNERFQPGYWTPLTLTLENRGRDVEGTLEVVVTSGSEYLQNIYESNYSADITLPYNVKQLYAFSIKLNSFTHDLQIRVRQGDETLLERSISLRSAATERPFALVVDEKASPDFLSDFPPQVFPVNVRPKFLPEQSYAYESVRVILLNIEMLPQLREKQFQALLKWIEQGGFLLLSGGMNIGAFSDPRARQLFPARILGHREFHELQALEDFCGRHFRSSKAFLLMLVHAQDAQTLLREDDFPLLALRTIDKGQVLFSALHYHASVFRTWEGKAAFWGKLFALRDPSQEADGPRLSAQHIQKAMLANLPAALPAPGLLILFLGVYLLLLRWIFRRIQRHRGQGWKNALAVTLLTLGAISGASLFFAVDSKKVPSHNVFVHLHGSTGSQQAKATLVTGLYTVQESDYRLEFESVSYPIEHLPAVPSRGGLPQTYQVHQSVKGQEVRGHSGDWSSQFFQLSDTLRFPLSAKAGMDEKGLELQLRNDGEDTLHNALLYFQQGIYFLEQLSAGEERKYRIPLAEIRENSSSNPSEFKGERYKARQPEKVALDEGNMAQFVRETLQKLSVRGNTAPYMPAMRKALLPETLDAVHARYHGQNDLGCLIGWMPASPIDIHVAQNAGDGESLSLLTWEIAIEHRID